MYKYYYVWGSKMIIEPVVIITNNPMVVDKMVRRGGIIFVEGNAVDVLKIARDYIHRNHRLLTHPLVSSIKPNEIPYRTVVISREKEKAMELKSLEFIENSIGTTEKFLKDFGIPNWNNEILLDFQLIDYDIINNAFK